MGLMFSESKCSFSIKASGELDDCPIKSSMYYSKGTNLHCAAILD